MQDQKRYTQFSVHDFICDTYFQDWVLHPDEEKNDFWRTWLVENPRQKTVVNEARMFLTNLAFRVDRPEEGKGKLALEKAWEQIAVLKQREKQMPILLRKQSQMGQIAALWILIVGTGLFIYLFNNRIETSRVTTTFG